MNPLPDRVVILGMLITLGVCFALVFWTVRLNPRPAPPPPVAREACGPPPGAAPQPSSQLL